MNAAPTDDAPAPGEDVFTEADLAPSQDDFKRARRQRFDRIAATVAVIALGLWSGGMVALGACAAPMVFKMTPYPYSAQAMGAAFGRFDNIAIGCGVVVLGCEIARTWLARSGRATIPRVRRYLAIILAAGAVYSATLLTPQIMQMHQAGVRRHQGPEGDKLESVHKTAELIGKVTVPSAMLLMALHIFTVRSREPDEELADAPLAPGAG